MSNLKYQNPASTDSFLDSQIADDTTTPETRREIVLLGSWNKYSQEDVINSLRIEIREQNANLLKILTALNSICIALNVMPTDGPVR